MNEIEARENYEWQELRKEMDEIGRCGNSIWLMARNKWALGDRHVDIIDEVRRMRGQKIAENPYYPDPNPNVPIKPLSHTYTWEDWHGSPHPSPTGRISSDPNKPQLQRIKPEPKSKSKLGPSSGPTQLPLF